MKLHALAGCRPQPLASYLAALGVFRLVHQQRDDEVRGFWRGDVFHLLTHLDREELLSFFLEVYAPTPLVDPWNGGSGFYPKDKAARIKGIKPILASSHARFDAYRQALTQGQELTRGMEKRPEKAEKTQLLEACRNSWSPEALNWFRAAVVITGDGEDFPALLGTGGNDGRLDFCSNFMQRLVELFEMETGRPAPGSKSLLEASLFGDPVGGLKSNAIGQFAPGSAGGVNATDGFSADSLLNTWDFVLMLEGALALSVAAVRGLDAHDMPRGSAPFAMRSTGAGFGTACRSEEDARGEQWMPLWSHPWSWGEVQAVFREGRMQLGRRRAKRATDAALALGTQGVARGIESFQRYAYIERLGQSKLAVPVGRWRVTHEPELDLVQEVLPWIHQLRSASRDPSRDPESLRRDVRRVETAILELARHPSTGAWQELFVALGAAEDGLARRPRHTSDRGLRPLPPLSPQWLKQIDDNSIELRLASALASQHGIRRHTLPLTRTKNGQLTFKDHRDVDVVWSGRDLINDLLGILHRQLLEAKRSGGDSLALSPSRNPRLSDVMAFITHRADDRRIAEFARPLMAVKAHTYWLKDDFQEAPLPAWAVMRLAYLPKGWQVGERTPVLDPTPLKRLAAGRLSDAVEMATRRLVASGLGRPYLTEAFGSSDLARRIGASLAFPISKSQLDYLAKMVARRHAKE